VNENTRVLTCAIHQPNLFPRLSTLAKIYAADVWIALDGAQFNHRDYQHRARLASLDDSGHWQWLSLPVHRPFGRSTRINEVLLLERDKSARRVVRLVQQHYGRAPHWDRLRGIVQEVANAIAVSTRLVDVTELSTRLLLNLLGWRGIVVRGSDLAARQERSARLADLTLAVGADEYLCGTGGARYLDERPFGEYGIQVRYFEIPDRDPWPAGHKVSALHWAAKIGAVPLQGVLPGGQLSAVYSSSAPSGKVDAFIGGSRRRLARRRRSQ
jgi:hypothetical protein